MTEALHLAGSRNENGEKNIYIFGLLVLSSE